MCYHDIYPLISSDSGCGYLIYGILCTYPCRAFVLNFENVCHYNVQNIKTTMQIVLYEGTSAIEFYIQSKPVNSGWNGGRCALGIQNANGTVVFYPPGRNTGVWTATNEAWRFTSAGTSINTFQWYLDGVPMPINQTTLNTHVNSDAQAIAITTYNCCGNTQIVVKDTVNIYVVHMEVSDIDSMTMCQGDTITLTADTSNIFSLISWSNGMTEPSIQISPSTSEMIYVYGYFHDGSYCTDSTYISVIDSVHLEFLVNGHPYDNAQPFYICENSSAQITATGANTYLWSTNETTPQITVSPDTTTTYSVIGNISSCVDTADITICIYPLANPEIIAKPTKGCVPLVVSFSFESDVPINECNWYLNNGVTSQQKNFKNKFNTAGTYDAKLIVKTTDGCIDSVFEPAIVQTYPLLNVAFSMSSHSIFTDEPLVTFTNESNAIHMIGNICYKINQLYSLMTLILHILSLYLVIIL